MFVAGAVAAANESGGSAFLLFGNRSCNSEFEFQIQFTTVRFVMRDLRDGI
jgi:hypothetical protein